MKIYDESDQLITYTPDLQKGWLESSKKLVAHHQAQPEQSHVETIPGTNGLRYTVIDKAAMEEYDEYEDVCIYHPINLQVGKTPSVSPVQDDTKHYKVTANKIIEYVIPTQETGLYKVTVTGYEKNYAQISVIVRLYGGENLYAYSAWSHYDYIASLNAILPVEAGKRYKVTLQLGSTVDDYTVSVKLDKITL